MLKSIIVAAALLTSFSALASDTPNNTASVMFAYDPLFWKHVLHLSKQQATEIEQINFDFYASVKAIAASGGASRNGRELLQGLTLDRSTRIWNVLSKRQHSKWERIMRNQYASKKMRSDSFRSAS
jgi:hypothetical protein